ncbi:MAG: L,D-transpeptidase family protein [Candidatus Paceibacterota bacterium]
MEHKTINTITGTTETVAEKIARLKGEVEVETKDIENLDEKIKNIETKIDVLNQRSETNQIKIEKLDDRITEIEKQLKELLEEPEKEEIIKQNTTEEENKVVINNEMIIDPETEKAPIEKEVDEIKTESETITVPEVLDEPLEIKVEEIIEQNITEEDRAEFQKENPDKPVEETIEEKIVEEINNNEIEPIEKRKKYPKFKKTLRRLKKLFIILAAVSGFEMTTSFVNPYSKEARAHDEKEQEIKVKDLKAWEGIKLYQDNINKFENHSLIVKANENLDEKYLIVDKEAGKTYLYQGDSLISSFNSKTGAIKRDDQTWLKSYYINENTRDTVSANEATYSVGGNSYTKDGYRGGTYWGKGNLQTGAGIYTITRKGDLHGYLAFFLENERKTSVATSIHENPSVTPGAKLIDDTNGCVGLSYEDMVKLFGELPEGTGVKVYITPWKSNHKFQIVDGEIRFISNEINVNKTIRPYEPKPIILKVEDVNEVGKEFLLAIENNKDTLMKTYPTVSNDVFNELSKLAYGIFGKESSFGTYGGLTGLRGQAGRAGDYYKMSFKPGDNPSVGVTQIKITSLSQEAKDAFNIHKTEDLLNIKNSAIATMCMLMETYVYNIPNKQKNNYEELVLLNYNNPSVFRQVIKGSKKITDIDSISKGYIKKALDYSNKVQVYLCDSKIYHLPGGDPTKPSSTLY